MDVAIFATIKKLLGNKSDTGGSTTDGTVYGKLNALLTSWTSARAAYIDSIRGYTVTNNTENISGTLSQKLSYLEQHSGNVFLEASSTVRDIKISTQVDVDSSCGYATYEDSRLFNFKAYSTGTIRMTVTAKQYSSSQTNRCKFEVYDLTNSEVVASLDTGSYVSSFTTKTVDFSISEGNNYGVAIGRTNGNDSGKYVSCNYLAFCYSRIQGMGNVSGVTI